MPGLFPNLLANGASGIAVGMATNIPPHNAAEVIGAALLLIENQNAELSELLEHVKGPRFPDRRHRRRQRGDDRPRL